MSPLCRLCERVQVDRTFAFACTRCALRLGDTLAEIGRLYCRLDPMPGRGAGVTRGAPGFRSSSPARDDVIVLTDPASKAGPDGPPSVRNALVGWWEVAAEHDLVRPPYRDATVGDAIRALADDATLDAAADYPWVVDFADELRILLGALRRVCGETEELIPIGECPEPGDRDGQCGGMVRARRFGESARCARCGTTWSGRHALRNLAARLGEALADAPGVARYFGIAESTVRTWAHRDRWTVHKHGRRRLYSLREARASWERRHAATG